MKQLSRRMVLKAAACGAVVLGWGRSVLAANSKLQHACIGVGGMMGGGDMATFGSQGKAEVVAVCDVDANNLAAAAKRLPNARTYADWREMLDKEGDRIDSINATVPDHMHAAITVSALRKGKHVFCQKPMAHDVFEARAMTKAAEQSGKVTQLGNQFGSSIGERMAIALLRSNVIGPVKHVVVLAHRGGMDSLRPAGPRPSKTATPPAHLKWDLWLGTAPERPYANGYHPSTWRGYQDFGTGWSGDIGCHNLNVAYQGLKLTAPLTIKARVQDSWAKTPERRGETWPQSNHITWTFPGTAHTADQLTVEWYDGEFLPPPEIMKLIRIPNFRPKESTLFIGSEGVLFWPQVGGPQLWPLNDNPATTQKFRNIERPQIAPIDHFRSYIEACLGGAAPQCRFVLTGPMTEVVLLGTVAVRMAGQELRWDAANLKFPNCPEAEKYLRRNYREGWKVEGL
jgi:predicted dehydrogenase